jgi:hypothetical protein
VCGESVKTLIFLLLLLLLLFLCDTLLSTSGMFIYLFSLFSPNIMHVIVDSSVSINIQGYS